MTNKEAVEKIEALIQEFAQNATDEEYQDALEEMIERSGNAYNALQEDLG
jgi:hypothetical protein